MSFDYYNVLQNITHDLGKITINGTDNFELNISKMSTKDESDDEKKSIYFKVRRLFKRLSASVFKKYDSKSKNENKSKDEKMTKKIKKVQKDVREKLQKKREAAKAKLKKGHKSKSDKQKKESTKAPKKKAKKKAEKKPKKKPLKEKIRPVKNTLAINSQNILPTNLNTAELPSNVHIFLDSLPFYNDLNSFDDFINNQLLDPSVVLATDGSKTAETTSYSVFNASNPVSSSVRRVSRFLTSTSAEALAISFSVDNYIKEKKNYYIFTDSESTLSALINIKPKSHSTVKLLHENLVNASKIAETINLIWVPSHSGIGPNEVADVLARSIDEETEFDPSVPPEDLKRELNKPSN